MDATARISGRELVEARLVERYGELPRDGSVREAIDAPLLLRLKRGERGTPADWGRRALEEFGVTGVVVSILG